MKHKYTIAGAGIILIAVALIGGTMAANNAQTSQAAEADISVNGLKGGIEASFEDPVFIEGSGVNAVPGGEYAIQKYAINTGSTGDYDAYFKAVIYKNWEDSNGDYIDPVENDSVIEDQVRIGDVKIDALDVGTTVNGWIVGYVDEEEVDLYYTKPVSVGESTENFIDAIAFSERLDNRFAKASYYVDFELSAVQTISGKEAFASAFGVYPVIDENGNIVSVSEEKPQAAN